LTVEHESLLKVPKVDNKYSITAGIHKDRPTNRKAQTVVSSQNPIKIPTSGPQQLLHKSRQKISKTGRIHVSKKAWAIRVVIVGVMIFMMLYAVIGGLFLGSPILLLALIIPAHSILSIVVGWFFFKNPAFGSKSGANKLVSIVIPVYNQENMIDSVIDAIFRSRYTNIEVIAVNDGSKDRTIERLNALAKKYPLKVIDKKNEGKRMAVAAGFYKSKGDIILLIDSDSILDEYAILEMTKALNSHPKIGGAVGHVKVWNANKNFLTKCQDSWYDSAFNIIKACESVFGSVTCISGCIAAYKRQAIEEFIPYWMQASVAMSDDRELTSFVIGHRMGKTVLKEMRKPEMKPSSLSEYLKEAAAGYDDAEDRLLTAQALEGWKTVYVPSATVYTDVPENFRGFLKQQQRWKKGAIRTNFFVSSFFWQKRNPLMTLIYYLEFMSTFSAPMVAFAILFYEPFINSQFLAPLFILGSSIFLEGLAIGLDYRMRDPSAKNWKYKPMMNLMTNFVLSWLLIPALLNLRKNNWGTR
jgi:hyaluronan synthase